VAKVRLIARLDIKGPHLIKGIHLEGLRKLGEPQQFATRYYQEGIDELLYIDVVASLYNRDNIREIVQHTAKNVFIPLTVGGGIRSVDDVRELLRSGADKVAINTAVTKRPDLIREVAESFGSQCMVLSVEAKRKAPGKWEAYVDNGREQSGLDVIEWIEQGVSLGAGEILITSVDCEGTTKGFDIDLLRAVASRVQVPVIASGGMGKIEHLVQAANVGGVDAVAMAHVLHHQKLTVQQIREGALQAGVEVRRL
jgi:imidazole glycerol-phosphate synthase subunit HisF